MKNWVKHFSLIVLWIESDNCLALQLEWSILNFGTPSSAFGQLKLKLSLSLHFALVFGKQYFPTFDRQSKNIFSKRQSLTWSYNLHKLWSFSLLENHLECEYYYMKADHFKTSTLSALLYVGEMSVSHNLVDFLNPFIMWNRGSIILFYFKPWSFIECKQEMNMNR